MVAPSSVTQPHIVATFNWSFHFIFQGSPVRGSGNRARKYNFVSVHSTVNFVITSDKNQINKKKSTIRKLATES